MTENVERLLRRLFRERSLSRGEYLALIEGGDAEARELAASLARRRREEVYGRDVFMRGLIEVGNVCGNDCLYCGIRRSNRNCERYVLKREQILDCCKEGYRLGFRTFVLQGGEGCIPVEEVCRIVSEIHEGFPDCAITLSLGEYSREEYAGMRSAGANRYLLRHETADREHYGKLHPEGMSFDNRMRCLRDLRELGFQVGCGFMVGSPYQDAECLAKELEFIWSFSPEMCGIGPFIPHKDTPFAEYPAGSLETTLYLLSLIRLIKPEILLPSTTALGTIHPRGREMGISAGANVVMPNLSPVSVRKKYELYNGKICTGEESAACRDCLAARIASTGYELVEGIGNPPGRADCLGSFTPFVSPTRILPAKPAKPGRNFYGACANCL